MNWIPETRYNFQESTPGRPRELKSPLLLPQIYPLMIELYRCMVGKGELNGETSNRFRVQVIPFGFENSFEIVGRKRMYSNEPEGMSTAFKPRVS